MQFKGASANEDCSSRSMIVERLFGVFTFRRRLSLRHHRRAKLTL